MRLKWEAKLQINLHLESKSGEHFIEKKTTSYFDQADLFA